MMTARLVDVMQSAPGSAFRQRKGAGGACAPSHRTPLRPVPNAASMNFSSEALKMMPLQTLCSHPSYRRRHTLFDSISHHLQIRIPNSSQL